MEGEFVFVEEFFRKVPSCGSYTAPVYGHADLKSVETMKISMVMRINTCERKAAVTMIKDRVEENVKIKAERE